MDKYIKYEDLKDYLNRQIQAFEPCPDKYDAAVGIYDGLHRIPAADVVPMWHGRWVKATGMMPPEYCGLHICSECGHYAGRKPPYGGREMLSDYCPNCGAKMDGE